MHIIRFDFMETVFSHAEQIGVLRFVVARFYCFCLSFFGVDPELVVHVNPGFASISPPGNIH